MTIPGQRVQRQVPDQGHRRLRGQHGRLLPGDLLQRPLPEKPEVLPGQLRPDPTRAVDRVPGPQAAEGTEGSRRRHRLPPHTLEKRNPQRVSGTTRHQLASYQLYSQGYSQITIASKTLWIQNQEPFKSTLILCVLPFFFIFHS